MKAFNASFYEEEAARPFENNLKAVKPVKPLETSGISIVSTASTSDSHGRLHEWSYAYMKPLERHSEELEVRNDKDDFTEVKLVKITCPCSVTRVTSKQYLSRTKVL